MDKDIRRERVLNTKKYKELILNIRDAIEELYYISDKFDAELEDVIELDVRECLRKDY